MDIEYLLWLQGLREAASPLVEQFFAAVFALTFLAPACFALTDRLAPREG